MRQSIVPAFATMITTLATSLVAQAASFTTFRSIGLAPDNLIFYGVSGDGSTFLGERRSDGDSIPYAEAITWDSTNGIRSLGLLPGGRFESVAYGSSFDGSRVIGSSSSAAGFEGFVWDESSGMRTLETSTGPDYSSTVSDITPDGSTIIGGRQVGLYVDPTTATDGGFDHPIYEAFRWTESEGIVSLGATGTTRFGSGATGITPDGSTIVGWTESTRGIESFVWNAETGMQLLGGFEGEEYINDQPTAVSADGSVIIGRGDLGRDRPFAFRFTRDRGMQILVDLEGGPHSVTDAISISADGSMIVGTTFEYHAPGEAFIWDSEHGMRSLKSILESLGVDLADWQLVSARLIGDDRTIFGYATNALGESVPYLAVIPEPGTAVLLAMGLAAIASYRFLPRNRD